MSRELRNAQITHVSYVDKAANQRKFFLTKSQDNPNFQKDVKLIFKADDAEQLVYGVVYEPDVLDAHNDFMTAEEIEKAAHLFLKDYRNMDTQHDFQAGVGDVLQSYIAPADFEVNGEVIKKGSWVLVTKASNEVWEAIQKGEITGYSMAGLAEAIQKQSEPSLDQNKGLIEGLINTLKSYLPGQKIQKGAVLDAYNAEKQSREFWAAQEALNRVLYWNVSSCGFEADPEKIREALTDYSAIVQQILGQQDIVKALGTPPVSIQKAGKKISTDRMNQIKAAYESLGQIITDVEGQDEGETELKIEDIAKMIKDELEPISKKLDALEKGAEPQEPAAATTDDVAKQLQEVLKAELAPINARLEAVEKARGISKAAGDGDEGKQPIAKSIWDGIL